MECYKQVEIIDYAIVLYSINVRDDIFIDALPLFSELRTARHILVHVSIYSLKLDAQDPTSHHRVNIGYSNFLNFW